jgi:hypothetical protein
VARPRLDPRTWLRRAAVCATLALVLLLAVTAIHYGVRFHTLAFWQLPDRISYCHRDYAVQDGPARTRSQIEATPVGRPGADPLPLVRFGRTIPLVGRPMWANLTPEDERAGLGVPCTMVIYLQTGHDAFVPYDLLGVP